MKVFELLEELKKNEHLEFSDKDEALLFIGSMMGRDKVIKALEKHCLLSSYCHQTSDGYVHLNWYQSVKSLVHELKVGKI